jgi:ferric-dicitrate binding protein FerR (iron transport regulator)
MGTSFNVQAFDQDDEVNVTLIEGKVNLQNSKGIVVSELSPGENAQFDLTKKNNSCQQGECRVLYLMERWLSGV